VNDLILLRPKARYNRSSRGCTAQQVEDCQSWAKAFTHFAVISKRVFKHKFKP